MFLIEKKEYYTLDIYANPNLPLYDLNEMPHPFDLYRLVK